VLFLGVGFIVVAKRFFVSTPGNAQTHSGRSKSTATNEPPKIQIITSLKLNAKSTLQLVEVGDQRVLVASDLNGIKSIVALNQPFAAALDQFDEPLESAVAESTPAGAYSPVGRAYAEAQPQPTPVSDRSPRPRSTSESAAGPREGQSQSTAEIEAEMKRQLAQLLGGQAFSDVFYNQTRAVA
jgi:flagellar biogenesis protein FliO